MPFDLFYTMVQKSQKWPKTQIKGGGSCLKLPNNQQTHLSQRPELYPHFTADINFFLYLL